MKELKEKVEFLSEQIRDMQREILKLKNLKNENCEENNSNNLQNNSNDSYLERMTNNCKAIINKQQNIFVLGYFDNGYVQDDFGFNMPIEQMKNIDSEDAELLFSALASENRVSILKLLLDHNCNANEIMDKCHFETTGKFYHHMNFLTNLSLVKKTREGMYYINSQMASQIITLFSCVYAFTANSRR